MSKTRKAKGNYDFLTGFAGFVPDVRGVLMLIFMFGIGGLIANVVSGLIILCLGQVHIGMEYIQLIAYPIMFVPTMLYARVKSYGNFGMDGYALNSSHFGDFKAVVLGLSCVVATLAMSFVMDVFNSMMPPMPERLENVLKAMTQGNFWINFVTAGVFAPVFEEWLCRGEILRGLLNYKRKDSSVGGDCQDRGMKPVWAIIISAAIFALIHLNPWQAIPAFALGLLFGFVYYKTGSLLLTMLMHAANNTFALIMGHIETFKDVDNWTEVIPAVPYYTAIVLFTAIVVVFVYNVGKIPMLSNQGNCDRTGETI